MSHAFLDHTGPAAIAHRGGALENVENTMAAFAHSVELGYSYAETDVHATADGVVVAFHDDNLARITKGVHTGLIRDLSWDEFRRIPIGEQERIPRLEEVLTTFPDLRLTIDPKSDSAAGPLMRVLEQTNLDRVCIGAFSDARLDRFAERFGDRLCMGLGPRAVTRLRLGLSLAQVLGRVVQIPPARFGIPLTDRWMIRAARRRGLAVHVWTIDERHQMETLLDRGVDGIMTDKPGLLRQVFEERGLWP